MSVTHSQFTPAPFDAVAARYDQTFTFSAIGQAQRAAVWRELADTFRAGDRVLEIGCGTGIDACFLASRGVAVVACDPSAEMIRVLTQRAAGMDLEKAVQARVLGAEDISSLRAEQRFDGAFSNFGAINCVEDLRKLGNDLGALLKPGAAVVLCWMGPCCLWEQVWYLLHGNREKAFRRFERDGVEARIADGAFVLVRYPSLGHIRRIFAPEFRVKSARGIGVAVPPSYLESWAQRHPRVLGISERADLLLARFPGIRSLGDHVLVRLQREGASGGD